MIDYKHGVWGMAVLLRGRGLVIPKALVWSLPCGAVTVLLHHFWETEKGTENIEMEGITTIWSSFTFVLGFLIVFRSNQAYSRFWESVTLFQQTSGEWTSAVSNLLSFCRQEEAYQEEVQRFQQFLIRLLSLMHCSALQTMCDLDDDSLEIISVEAVSDKSLMHLKNSPDRAETVLLWIQRLIIEANNRNLFEVPAPILSRAFQELSRGMVGVTDVRKVRMVPFPFPYSQYLSLMLIWHWILTPIVACHLVVRPWWAGAIVTVVSTSFWTLFYIAQEIDQPFGEDPNDLPVREMQKAFNEKLEFFAEPLSYMLPKFDEQRVRSSRTKKTQVLNSSFTFIQSATRSKSLENLARELAQNDKDTSSSEPPRDETDLRQPEARPSQLDEVVTADFNDQEISLEELRALVTHLLTPTGAEKLLKELEEKELLAAPISLPRLRERLADVLARHDPASSELLLFDKLLRERI